MNNFIENIIINDNNDTNVLIVGDICSVSTQQVAALSSFWSILHVCTWVEQVELVIILCQSCVTHSYQYYMYCENINMLCVLILYKLLIYIYSHYVFVCLLINFAYFLSCHFSNKFHVWINHPSNCVNIDNNIHL